MTWLEDDSIRQPERTDFLTTEKDLDVDTLSIVIPVKNNQPGIDKLLSSFFANIADPDKSKAIIIVDNNSDIPIEISREHQKLAKKHNVNIVVQKCATPGPAAARNVGWHFAVDHGAKWILFVDSDCVFNAKTIPGYKLAMDGSVAYQGSVAALSDDWLSEWYIDAKILTPKPFTDPLDQKIRPNYIITANVLVHRDGLLHTRGFNESFKLAAGEDVWLGYMLSDLGTLAYAPKAAIYHDYLDGSDSVRVKNIVDLIKRFERYGNGNYTVDKLRGTEDKPGVWPGTIPIDEYIEYKEKMCKSDPEASVPTMPHDKIQQLIYTALMFGFDQARSEPMFVMKKRF